MNQTREVTYEEVASRIGYNPETGAFFRTRKTHWGDVGSPVTGTVNSRGYLVLLIVRQRPILAHRLAYLLMKRQWPPDQIDHINRVKTDNRWANLREATAAQNSMNSRHRAGLLPRGVNFDPRKGKKGGRPYWARISVNNKQRYIGSFKTETEAAEAYRTEAKKFHGAFAILD